MHRQQRKMTATHASLIGAILVFGLTTGLANADAPSGNTVITEHGFKVEIEGIVGDKGGRSGDSGSGGGSRDAPHPGGGK